MKKIAWCTGHYRTDFTKKKAKELRWQGYKVSFGSYVKEDGKTFCKIYIETGFDYEVLHILNNIVTDIRTGTKIHNAVSSHKQKIIDLAKENHKAISVELEGDILFARIDDDKILRASI